jgi:hypothetical protein
MGSPGAPMGFSTCFAGTLTVHPLRRIGSSNSEADKPSMLEFKLEFDASVGSKRPGMVSNH